MANIIYKINQGETDYNIASSAYCTCSTAAGTAAKVANLQNSSSNGFTLATGITIHVKFTYSNTVASPTLNVNGTGAKSIMRYGTTAVSTSAPTSWRAGAVVSFTYDGTNWVMNTGIDDSGTINNAGLAAKPIYIENGEAKQCTGISPELSISEYATGKVFGDALEAAFNPTVSMAASTGTNQLTLSHGSKYSISVNGKSFVFTMPSSPLNAVGFGTMTEMGAFKYHISSGQITESCHIQGYISEIWTTGYVNVTSTAYHVTLWQGDNLHFFTYNRTSSTWTTEDSRTFSRTNHTHTTSLAAGTSSDTSSITLSHGSKYKLTAGGNSVVFTMPSQYSLPLAASGTRGGVKIGYSASGANIPLKLSSEKGYVTLTGSAIKSAIDGGGDLSWTASSYTFKDGTSSEALKLDSSLIYQDSSGATKMVVGNTGNMGIAGYLYQYNNTSKRAPWSSNVYNIEKVTALPASPNANTLYIVVEG